MMKKEIVRENYTLSQPANYFKVIFTNEEYIEDIHSTKLRLVSVYITTRLNFKQCINVCSIAV